MAWHVFAAVSSGSSHLESGQPCQDACAHQIANNVLCAVVCDGAGSSTNGHLGAQHVATAMAQKLAERVSAKRLSPDSSAIIVRQAIEELLEQVRSELAERAAAVGASLADCATTLVGALASGQSGWLFHVGDGVAVARPDDVVPQTVISAPENGEYCNETYFVTGERWREHLRLTPVCAPLRGVVLMSDGAAPFVMARGGNALFAPFIDPIDRFLEKAELAAGSRALVATLSDPRTYAITSDDKALLIAQWREPAEQATARS
jgi:hypothetical protein